MPNASPVSETDRLAALARYAVLDTAPEAAFDRITSLAAHPSAPGAAGQPPTGHGSQGAPARRETVLAAALDAIIGLDQAGRVIEPNPAAERLFGHDLAATAGQEFAALFIAPGGRAAYRRDTEGAYSGGDPSRLGERLSLPALYADGTEFPVELVITPINEAGQVRGSGVHLFRHYRPQAGRGRLAGGQTQSRRGPGRSGTRQRGQERVPFPHEPCSRFEPNLSSTGSGFGLTVVADFVADAFGLRDRQEALRERYVGAILDGQTFRVWFHWPRANDDVPAMRDEYQRPQESLSEPGTESPAPGGNLP